MKSSDKGIGGKTQEHGNVIKTMNAGCMQGEDGTIRISTQAAMGTYEQRAKLWTGAIAIKREWAQ